MVRKTETSWCPKNWFFSTKIRHPRPPATRLFFWKKWSRGVRNGCVIALGRSFLGGNFRCGAEGGMATVNTHSHMWRWQSTKTPKMCFSTRLFQDWHKQTNPQLETSNRQTTKQKPNSMPNSFKSTLFISWLTQLCQLKKLSTTLGFQAMTLGVLKMKSRYSWWNSLRGGAVSRRKGVLKVDKVHVYI